jgi:hypothetical protein
MKYLLSTLLLLFQSFPQSVPYQSATPPGYAVNLAWFPADSRGVQRAVDLACTLAAQGIQNPALYIPTGRYFYVGTLTLSCSPFTLWGDGIGLSNLTILQDVTGTPGDLQPFNGTGPLTIQNLSILTQLDTGFFIPYYNAYPPPVDTPMITVNPNPCIDQPGGGCIQGIGN